MPTPSAEHAARRRARSRAGTTSASRMKKPATCRPMTTAASSAARRHSGGQGAAQALPARHGPTLLRWTCSCKASGATLCGDRRLAEGDPAVVGRQALGTSTPQARRSAQPGGAVEQQPVLEDAARQDRDVGAAPRRRPRAGARGRLGQRALWKRADDRAPTGTPALTSRATAATAARGSSDRPSPLARRAGRRRARRGRRPPRARPRPGPRSSPSARTPHSAATASNSRPMLVVTGEATPRAREPGDRAQRRGVDRARERARAARRGLAVARLEPATRTPSATAGAPPGRRPAGAPGAGARRASKPARPPTSSSPPQTVPSRP